LKEYGDYMSDQSNPDQAQAPMNDRSYNPLVAVFDLFSHTKFAIIIIITIAVASILGIFIVDQVPVRGEMAARAYADRSGEPLVWFLTHMVPERPFSYAPYRVLLALLSLSLSCCIIKRWRWQWSRALAIRPARDEMFSSNAVTLWHPSAPPAADDMAAFLKKHLYALKIDIQGDTIQLSGSRFGAARLGALFTHFGFLFLVFGGLYMSSFGVSTVVWMAEGDRVNIADTDGTLELVDFEIETNERGQVRDYISKVKLYRNGDLLKEMIIEVNNPLRYKGHSLYQASYRRDPYTVRSLDLMYDVAPPEEKAATTENEGNESNAPHGMSGMGGMDGMNPHADGDKTKFLQPATVTLRHGEMKVLAGTPFSVVIDTFLADFRIAPEGPYLGSDNPVNPAVHLSFFAENKLAGGGWYFLMHPGMVVGEAPEGAAVRFAAYEPNVLTGLELATHPGSGWIWAGFIVMTIGTLLSFMLKHQEVWLRLRRQNDKWELAMVHSGSTPQDPDLVSEKWQRSVSSLTLKAFTSWPAAKGKPEKMPTYSRFKR
jgi:cytochrome c biogenesis protein ResB